MLVLKSCSADLPVRCEIMLLRDHAGLGPSIQWHRSDRPLAQRWFQASFGG